MCECVLNERVILKDVEEAHCTLLISLSANRRLPNELLHCLAHIYK